MPSKVADVTTFPLDIYHLPCRLFDRPSPVGGFFQNRACTGASKERQTRANPAMSCSIKRKPLHRLIKIDTVDMLITAKCASFKWFADIILYEIP